MLDNVTVLPAAFKTVTLASPAITVKLATSSNCSLETGVGAFSIVNGTPTLDITTTLFTTPT